MATTKAKDEKVPVKTTRRGGQRKLSRAGADTRTKLLNAAERLFADKGFDGTSLRDIATKADQHLALSTYHFGTKEKLFEEVIRRRASELNEIRMAKLAAIDFDSLSRSDAVRALIEAYTLPIIHARYSSSRQWQAHVRLLSQLISVRRWIPLIRSSYDACGTAYIERFEQVLPHVEHDRILDAFSFMISNMLYVCSYSNRFSALKTVHLADPEETARATGNFLRFCHAGFMGLE